MSICFQADAMPIRGQIIPGKTGLMLRQSLVHPLRICPAQLTKMPYPSGYVADISWLARNYQRETPYCGEYPGIKH